jgi:hypothetical protein
MMPSHIVPPGQQAEVKRKARRAELMEQYREQLEAATPRERKALLREIERQVKASVPAPGWWQRLLRSFVHH